MTRVEAIEEQIRELTPDEQAELRSFLRRLCAPQYDITAAMNRVIEEAGDVTDEFSTAASYEILRNTKW